MLFVKTEDLKPGMRLAKPIYNKNGVMLYERNSKITSQGIISVENFGLIGIYVLEPAEPVPPMSEDDIEFERFQAMSIFIIREILDAYSDNKKDDNMYQFINQLLKKYGSLHHKINFIQNLRSNDDYIYKHSLNTAILCALISNKLGLAFKDQLDLVAAALLHDVGGLSIPVQLRKKKTEELMADEGRKIVLSYQSSWQEFKNNTDLSPDIRRILTVLIPMLHPDMPGAPSKFPEILSVEILKVAYYFDNMTAMKFGDEPLSEIAAVRYLLDHVGEFDKKVVDALLDSINILSPGVCVEFTNGDKGLVVTSNESNVLEPFVLSFKDNKLYNLGDSAVARSMQIKDIMKTMDNRHVVDSNLLQQYTGNTLHMGEKI